MKVQFEVAAVIAIAAAGLAVLLGGRRRLQTGVDCTRDSEMVAFGGMDICAPTGRGG